MQEVIRLADPSGRAV